MMFIKRPIPVEAKQWFKIGDHPAVVLFDGVTAIEGAGWIKTLEGGHIVTPSDWIIKGVRGEFYPCKDDIFRQTYEDFNLEPYDSSEDTGQHRLRVCTLMRSIAKQIEEQGVRHDSSKLSPEEKPLFDKYTPLLKYSVYGSDEYKANLAGLGAALQHHYKHNAHHPEHYRDGVAGMNVVNLVEMICDWKAASERHATGSLEQSIEINAKRFSLDPQLVSIIKNTWFLEEAAHA